MATTERELQTEDLSRLRRDLPLYAAGNLQIRTKPESGGSARLDPLRFNLAQELLNAKADWQKATTGRVRAIVLKARQEGVSTGVAARIYHGCTLWARRRGKVLADVLKRAAEIFEIYERFEAEAAIRPTPRSTRRARELSWQIDSQITVDTARDPDSGRGGTNDFVHASEFASWLYPAETLAGLLESIPSGAGEAWIESTAKGVGNEFHAMWEAAVQGESEWMPIFLPWWIDEGYRIELSPGDRDRLLGDLDPWEVAALSSGISWEERPSDLIPAVLASGAVYDASSGRWCLQPEQIAWRRRKIREGGELRFTQENPATSEEAFLVSGSPFFDQSALQAQRSTTRPPIARGNFVHLPGSGVAFADGAGRGHVRIWEHPDPDGHYVVGADTAEGRMAAASSTLATGGQAERGGRDFSSADVLKLSELREGPDGTKIRVPCLRQVAQIHGREGLPPDVFAAQVAAAGAWWSCPGRADAPQLRRPSLVGVERNHSSGQTTIHHLLTRWRYVNLFVHQRVNVYDNVTTPEFGWVTDGSSRPLMLDALEEVVRTGGLEVCSTDTLREMRTFVRGGGRAEEGKQDDGRPAAQRGCHDDRVMGIAIALQMRGYHACGSGAAAVPDVPVYDTPTGM